MCSLSDVLRVESLYTVGRGQRGSGVGDEESYMDVYRSQTRRGAASPGALDLVESVGLPDDRSWAVAIVANLQPGLVLVDTDLARDGSW